MEGDGLVRSLVHVGLVFSSIVFVRRVSLGVTWHATHGVAWLQWGWACRGGAWSSGEGHGERIDGA